MFAPLSHCFELYGVDFLVDDTFQVHLLEANPGPDFKQTGGRLKAVIENLIEVTLATVFSEEDGGDSTDVQQISEGIPSSKVGGSQVELLTKVYDEGSHQSPGARLRLF